MMRIYFCKNEPLKISLSGGIKHFAPLYMVDEEYIEEIEKNKDALNFVNFDDVFNLSEMIDISKNINEAKKLVFSREHEIKHELACAKYDHIMAEQTYLSILENVKLMNDERENINKGIMKTLADISALQIKLSDIALKINKFEGEAKLVETKYKTAVESLDKVKNSILAEIKLSADKKIQDINASFESKKMFMVANANKSQKYMEATAQYAMRSRNEKK